jgi:hypothetical protein
VADSSHGVAFRAVPGETGEPDDHVAACCLWPWVDRTGQVVGGKRGRGL